MSVKEVYQYPDSQSGDEDVFAREPFVVWFSSPKTGKCLGKHEYCVESWDSGTVFDHSWNVPDAS